jgi:hypothetical protein
MRKKQVNHIFTKKELARLRAAAVAKRKEGKCYALIAQELGVTAMTAFNWCIAGGCGRVSPKRRMKPRQPKSSRPGPAEWVLRALAMKKEAA